MAGKKTSASTKKTTRTKAQKRDNYTMEARRLSMQLRREITEVMQVRGGSALWKGLPEFCSVPVTNDTVMLAMNIATRVHAQQTDRANMPYINHPVYVSKLFNLNSYKVIALLHDVIEDGDDVTEAKLVQWGIPQELAHAVNCLSAKDSYNKYIQKLCNPQLTPPYVLNVKLADMYHNADYTRLPAFGEHEVARFHKYINALHTIKGSLGICVPNNT